MNHHSLSHLFVSGFFVAWCSSCTCYRSFVEADFHEHGADSRKHQDFTAHWKEGDGYHNSLNPVFMIDTRSESGEVEIISHQAVGVHSNLVFEEIILTNKSGHSVASNLLKMPLSIRFKETESSRYVERDEWVDYRKNLAKVKFKPDVSISGSPYTMRISGYHLKKSGAKVAFRSSIRMDLSRSRRLENIANCWP